MINLYQWAAKWSIPFAAVHDLREQLGTIEAAPGPTGRSEAAAQAAFRVEASQRGLRLWRNNNGVLLNANGQPVRFGLNNDSPAQNKAMKSSDLIGIDPSPIRPEDVGQPRGQLCTFEVKEQGWHFTGTPREQAQLAWILHIQSLGGRGGFINRPGML